MAGSIPGSDLADRAAARPAATVAPPRDRRWGGPRPPPRAPPAPRRARGLGVAVAGGPARPAATVAPPRDRRWDVLRRAARARLAPFGAGVVVLAMLVALAAPLLAPYDPLAQNLGNALARPGRANLLGTDNVGRDVLSRA